VRMYDTPMPNLSAQCEKIYAFTAWNGVVPYWLMDPNGVLYLFLQFEESLLIRNLHFL
jgi:hypothetical protein